jgi:hypothetical protein
VRAAAGSLSVLVGVGLALRVWAAFGTILLPGSEVDPGQVLADRALAFGFYVLWIPVLAITYRRDPRGRMWKLILFSFVMDCWWVFGGLHNPFAGIGWTIGTFTQPLAAAVLAHMALAFPSGRLRDRTDLWLLGIIYTIVVPVQLLRRSNQGIADRLVLELRTVEGHVGQIFSKLRLEPSGDDHRRVLAVLTALRNPEAG